MLLQIAALLPIMHAKQTFTFKDTCLHNRRCYYIIFLCIVILVAITVIVYRFAGVYNSCSIYIVVPGPKYSPTHGEIWPLPQNQVKENKFFVFEPSTFLVNVSNFNCNILNGAIDRANLVLRNLYSLTGQKQRTVVKNSESWPYFVTNTPDGDIRELRINLTSPCEEYPHFHMDESYNLTVAAVSFLESSSIWGIIRGLETWTQLFYLSHDYKKVHVNGTRIHDYPQYKYRGLLIDTGRHYLPVATILGAVDALAANKMNVLHWHIIDDQSFPFQSTVFPDLSKGAFHPSMIYSKSDIGKIVNYARDRGVRVIPEIDMPGHVRSWGVAFPNILTKCYIKGKLVALGPLNPIQNATYEVLKDLIHEVEGLFPDKYFHIGGDEVDKDCWTSNPEIKQYMYDNGLSASQLHAIFMRRVMQQLRHKIPIVWQEVFDENVPLPKEPLIQVWRYEWIDEMIKIINAGHLVLFSSSWYLDYLNFDWDSFYIDDPRQMVYKKSKNAANLEKVVGGEACMWGEKADNTNVMSRTWPRTSAVAERLWTGMDYKIYDTSELLTTKVRQRIEEHTCRMNRRGIHAQPPSGPGFCYGAI